MIAVKPVPCQHQPGYEGSLPRTMKALGFCIHRKYWKALLRDKHFQPKWVGYFPLCSWHSLLVSAAVSGVVLLRRCESQADFLLTLVSVMTVLSLISIHPHSLRSTLHRFLSLSLSLSSLFKTSNLLLRKGCEVCCEIYTPLENNFKVMSWFYFFWHYQCKINIYITAQSTSFYYFYYNVTQHSPADL